MITEMRLANQRQQTSTAVSAYENMKTSALGLRDQNDYFVKQNTALADALVGEQKRADRADSLLAPLQKRLCKYEGCSWAGKQIRKVDKTAKYIGYGGIVYTILKLFVF